MADANSMSKMFHVNEDELTSEPKINQPRGLSLCAEKRTLPEFFQVDDGHSKADITQFLSRRRACRSAQCFAATCP